MKRTKFILLAAATWCLGSFFHQTFAQNWALIPGAASDIGVGANGTVWSIGTTAEAGGFSIFKYSGSSFVKVPGGAVRIAVDPQGNAWVVNSGNDIFKYNGTSWTTITGQKATDIAVGANGTVWAIGTAAESGGYGIHKMSGTTWMKIPGGAVRIAVDPQGNPWVVNSLSNIFKYNGSGWTSIVGSAKDIGIGADGTVWIVGANNSVSKWNGSTWELKNGSAANISVGPAGEPWIVNAQGQISYAPNTPPINTAQTVNMKFVNRGTKAVEIWTTTAQGLAGTKVTDIGNQGQVSIPVKYGDQFLVRTPYIASSQTTGGDPFSYHPKIVISDLNAPAVEIHGNLPCNEFRSTGGVSYKVMDYEYNCQGIDLTQLNPRDLVTTINKPMLFEKINPASDVDFHYTGDKIMKYGFTYSAKNLSSGDNSVRMSYGYSSFSKDFSINVKGAAPVGAAEVGAGASFKMTESNEKSNESVYTYTREQKSVFEVQVDPKKARLNQSFIQSVHAINDIFAARALVEQYGTHYAKSIMYGGDRSLYMVCTKEEYSNIKSFGIDLKVEVALAKKNSTQSITASYDANNDFAGQEVTYGSKSSPAGSGSIGFGYNESSVVKSKLENKTMKYRLIGGTGSFESWSLTENNAAPVYVDVDKISNLIDPLVFKDGSDPAVLAQKKALVLQAIMEKLGGMDQLGPALPSPRAYVIEVPNWHVDDAVPDDANSKMQAMITINLSNNSTTPGKYSPSETTLHHQGTWVNSQFVHNKTHTIDKKFTFIHYPEPNGTFDNLFFRINGGFTEQDDLDASDNFSGNSGFINANTLVPGTKVSNYVKCWGDRQETGIHIHYNLLRELDAFAPILAGI